MKVSAKVIIDPKKLSEDENEIDIFLKENSENPFMLLSFIKNAMNEAIHSVRVPVFIIVRVDGEIVGVASFVFKEYFGIRSAEFLTEFWTSPNFITKDNFAPIVIRTILRLIPKTLNSKFMFLYMNRDSENLSILKRICASKNIPFFDDSNQSLDYGVIPVNCSWDDFKKTRGRHFWKELNYVENKLNRKGIWKVTVFENYDESDETIYKKILDVEKLSWKERHRQLRGETVDTSILWFLYSSSTTKDNSAILRRKIWFLELNNQAVAYSMVFQYKGIAYIAKTSFVEEYRKLGLGKFIIEVAIKNLFDKKEVHKIDFMTYVPLVGFWKADRLERVRLRLGSRVIVNFAFAMSIPRLVVAHLYDINKLSDLALTAQSQLNRAKRKKTFHLPRFLRGE